jgi:hypothetical protein
VLRYAFVRGPRGLVAPGLRHAVTGARIEALWRARAGAESRALIEVDSVFG